MYTALRMLMAQTALVIPESICTIFSNFGSSGIKFHVLGTNEGKDGILTRSLMCLNDNNDGEWNNYDYHFTNY